MVLMYQFNFNVMRKILYQFIVASIFVSVCSHTAIAQNIDYASAKEKIYVQTSHVFFKQGETAFFKIYVVNAKDQTPASISSIVYVDIINPSGNVLQKLN